MPAPDEKGLSAKILDGAIIACLFLFAVAAPHSIAGAQSSWLLGMALWISRFAIRPRPVIERTPIDYFVLGFFILSGLSAVFSYSPMISIGKMRAASLFTIIYLVVQNVRSMRLVRLLAVTLISSCMINVLFTASERLLGRGVKIDGLTENSVLYKAGLRNGDTLQTLDGEKLHEPQDIVNGLSRPSQLPAAVKIYRVEWEPTFEIPRGDLLPSNTALEQLGFTNWSRGRDWRASGFFGHYVTYAEVLQLVLALTLGLFVSAPKKRDWTAILLLTAVVGLGFSLLMTVTRAVWLGCLVSSLIILALTIRRRTLLLIGAFAVPLIFGGLYLLQLKRNVGFFDRQDASTTWRETVWRGGFKLLVSNPRHLLLGVGMDSIKGHWRAWGLFDGGRIPMGHMHSNFLQIALERGIPALCLWLTFLAAYARSLWRLLRSAGSNIGWMERGILLGALGGLAGFFVSGIVHYNWGDSEVVMVLYFIMGMVLAIEREARKPDRVKGRTA
ncbi:MAG TPA: O-antigen ligase family protein [Pyrinomonadaceae bacterium]|nr:O-antigen ligase family protein [Pyrinomonadaceae bacterium]